MEDTNVQCTDIPFSVPRYILRPNSRLQFGLRANIWKEWTSFFFFNPLNLLIISCHFLAHFTVISKIWLTCCDWKICSSLRVVASYLDIPVYAEPWKFPWIPIRGDLWNLEKKRVRWSCLLKKNRINLPFIESLCNFRSSSDCSKASISARQSSNVTSRWCCSCSKNFWSSLAVISSVPRAYLRKETLIRNIASEKSFFRSFFFGLTCCKFLRFLAFSWASGKMLWILWSLEQVPPPLIPPLYQCWLSVDEMEKYFFIKYRQREDYPVVSKQ